MLVGPVSRVFGGAWVTTAGGWGVVTADAIARTGTLELLPLPDDLRAQIDVVNSFVAQGVSPPESAQNALYAAMELAPSDGELRYKVARDFEHRNMIPDAIAIIRPIAYASPHRGTESESERQLRERREQRERGAGEIVHETPREMLARLEEKASHLPGAPVHAATPPQPASH